MPPPPALCRHADARAVTRTRAICHGAEAMKRCVCYDKAQQSAARCRAELPEEAQLMRFTEVASAAFVLGALKARREAERTSRAVVFTFTAELFFTPPHCFSDAAQRRLPFAARAPLLLSRR